MQVEGVKVKLARNGWEARAVEVWFGVTVQVRPGVGEVLEFSHTATLNACERNVGPDRGVVRHRQTNASTSEAFASFAC